MRTSRSVTPRAVAAVIAALTAAAVWLAPAAGQDRPESILPPGFGEPTPAPTASATPRPAPTGPVVSGTAPLDPLALPGAVPTPLPTPTATPTPIDPEVLAYYELPPFARHPLSAIGPVTAGAGGLPADAWGEADGGYLETLMRRLSAPLPSRWLSILLRRTLLSQTDTPRHADGANFAAERAWLLLRMGEAGAARALVQGVDNGDYTPKLYQVALNAMLATGDPTGLCPLAAGGQAVTGERGWVLADAMCAALGGGAQRAGALVAAARRRHVAGGIDLLLARKVIGAGAQGRAAITIDWAGVDRLTVWRFGLATATGVTIPDELVAATGPQVRYWQALAPSVAPGIRVPAAEAAAAQGVLSNAALVDLYGATEGDDAAPPAAVAAAQDLRAAYVERDAGQRVAALRRLWGEREGEKAGGYARLVLTARAAARVPVGADVGPDTDRVIAAMLAAGLDRHAARWRGVVTPGTDAWAMVALADPDGTTLPYGELASYSGSGDARLKQRLFFAGLAGLGRLSPEDIERAAAALDVRIGVTNAWTQAIDRAAADNEPATVVLLAGIGMQAASWRGVPPSALYRIVGALRAVGLESEARMIAAEALARA